MVNTGDFNFVWDPYPSDIVVSNVLGTVEKVTVTINNYTDPVPNHERLLLQAPNSTSVLIVSRAGNSLPVNDVTYTIDDDASSMLPENGQIVSGTFQPSNYGPNDNLPSPAPQTAPYPTALSAFNGINPNGTWRLWIQDTEGGHDATIDNWELTILSCV